MELHFKNKVLGLSVPSVMGILNVTPDSFYDGSRYNNEKAILSHAEKMLSEEADIIDIGACSTRPKSAEVPEKEELKRLLPAIQLVRKHFPGAIISADTFRSGVAAQAVQAGADMVNDISGGTLDKQMFDTIGKLNIPYVLMHIQGTPQTMQDNPHYGHVTSEVMNYFSERIKLALLKGIKQIVIDPGFGFGKTTAQNYTLLKETASFKQLGYPVLAGISRKSMICRVLGVKPENALNGTTAANMLALLNGANMLRVHDVREAREAVKIFTFMQ